MKPSHTTYTVTRVVRPSTGDWLEDALADHEFRVIQESAPNSDIPPFWYTVIARPADNKDGYRFGVWSGSRFRAASGRGKAQMPRHAVTRLEVIEAVKAHLAAQ